jgi:hypothetical protein
MGPFTDSVYVVMERYVMSPWNALKAECAVLGLDPLTLAPTTLPNLVERLVVHVARLTDSDNAVQMRDDLLALVALHTSGVRSTHDSSPASEKGSIASSGKPSEVMPAPGMLIFDV